MILYSVKAAKEEKGENVQAEILWLEPKDDWQLMERQTWGSKVGSGGKGQKGQGDESEE